MNENSKKIVFRLTRLMLLLLIVVPTPKLAYAQLSPIIHLSAIPNKKALIVLINFNDRKIMSSDEEWNDKIFGKSGETVRNFYDEISGGEIIYGPIYENNGIANDGVIRIDINENHPGIAGRTKNEVERDFYAMYGKVLGEISKIVNLETFDADGDNLIENSELNIILVAAGFDRSRTASMPALWPSASQIIPQFNGKYYDDVIINVGELLSHDALTNAYVTENVFTICHELGHLFDAEDLYSSGGLPLQKFSIMETGDTHFDAYSMELMGLIKPVIANKSGVYTVNSFNSPKGYNVLRINTINPSEYFFVENRQFIGFDQVLYNKDTCAYPGIAIYHVDTSKSQDEPPYKVQLEQPLSLYKSRLFSKECNVSIFNESTTPNSNLNSPRMDDPTGSNKSSNFKLEVLSNNGDSIEVYINAEEIYTDYNKKPVFEAFTATRSFAKDGTINLKAIVTDKLSNIRSVLFRATNGQNGGGFDVIGENVGDNTWEATVDLKGLSGTYSFYPIAENNLRVKASWAGKRPSITIDPSISDGNLALNKPATASNQLLHEPSSKAVNGTTYSNTSNVNDKWCTGIGNGNGSWLKVDLGELKTINRWKVINERGSGSEFKEYCPSDFRLQYSVDGVDNWIDVDVVTGNTLGITDRMVDPFSARYVRLYIDIADKDNCARICEFQLFNDQLNGFAADFDSRPIKQMNSSTRISTKPHSKNKIAYSEYVFGYTPNTQPQCSVTTEKAHSNRASVMVAGNDSNAYYSYCYFTLYDDLNIKITDKTQISYWMYPTNQNSRFVGLDVLFTDGTTLRGLKAFDQNGTTMHPNGGRGIVNTWNQIKCNIGQYPNINGKVIKQIMLAYDQYSGTGTFKTYVDDIIIREIDSDYSGIKADFEGQNLVNPMDKLFALGALDCTNTVAFKTDTFGTLYCYTTSTKFYNGSNSLFVAGVDKGGNSYCYFDLYNNVNKYVSRDTKLSYWIYPDNEYGRFVGVDIEFTDGTFLRTTDVVDFNGNKLIPESGHGNVGKWNYITAKIGDWCNGKTIKNIRVGYEHANSSPNSSFRAYIDDVVLTN